jgi:hypothetical protein
MNVVFLSPHFPPSVAMFCIRLRELGATVLGLADSPYQSLRPELRAALTEYYRVDDLHDRDALVRALGYFTHRYGKIDRIDSLNEYWLETEAQLRTDFNITGIRADEIDRVKRKSHMKRIFERAGIWVPRGRLCRTAPDARRFVAEFGYPIIAKPDVGVGATRTYRLDSDLDLEAYLGDKPAIDYILEEAISGTLLSYDGLVDRAGEVVFSSTLTYGLPVLDAVRGGDMFYWLGQEVPDDLEEVGRRTVRAFRLRERPFHFEFFRLDDGALVALEVNVRQPGGLTVDMFNYANEIDFYRAWAQVVTTGTTELELTRPFHCLYAGRKTGRVYRLAHEDVLGRFAGLIVRDERIDDVFSSAIGNHGYILRHRDLEPLLEAAAAIREVVP